jgi:hypothetical protein
MWIIALMVVLALLAVIALRRFGPMRNTERLRRTDPEAAARAEQRLAEHQAYNQIGRGGRSGGF